MPVRVYLDNAATTRLDERVLAAMQPFFCDNFGNASSLHSYGVSAKSALNSSREQLASLIGASPTELVFTSGGTESNNLALKGVALSNRHKGNHIVVSSIEHDCVLNSCKWLEEQGFFITYLPVDNVGVVDVEYLEKVINPKTILVSVMHANNEIGTIQPLETIGAICRSKNVLFHSDACQSFGKLQFNVDQFNIDLLTINSHKIYGPKGVGALYVRNGTPITPLLHGGGQEAGLRSTTENIPGVVGFAKAAELSYSEMETEFTRLTLLRDRFISQLFNQFENAYLNGHPTQRLPGHINFSFHGLEGETIRILLLLEEMGVAVSAGSACSSNDKSHNASHVLKAIGLNPFEARGGIRISMGRFTNENEIEFSLNAIKQAVPLLTSIFN